MTKYGFASGAVNSSNKNLFESRASRRMTSACPVATLTSSDSPALSRRTRRHHFPVSKGHLLVLGHRRRQSHPLSSETICVGPALERANHQTSRKKSQDSPSHDQERRVRRNNRLQLFPPAVDLGCVRLAKGRRGSGLSLFAFLPTLFANGSFASTKVCVQHFVDLFQRLCAANGREAHPECGSDEQTRK